MALNSDLIIDKSLPVPAGYSKPVTAIALTDPREAPYSVDVDTSLVDHASDPAAGFTALAVQLKGAIDTDVIEGADMGIDTTTFTVDAIITLKSVQHVKPNGNYRTGSVYRCTGMIYYEVS